MLKANKSNNRRPTITGTPQAEVWLYGSFTLDEHSIRLIFEVLSYIAKHKLHKKLSSNFNLSEVEHLVYQIRMATGEVLDKFENSSEHWKKELDNK